MFRGQRDKEKTNKGDCEGANHKIRRKPGWKSSQESVSRRKKVSTVSRVVDKSRKMKTDIDH